MTKYYKPDGTYVAYTTDDKNLFNDTAEHIGYFSNGFLYNIQGKAIGHIKGKQILDKGGHTLYFTT